MSIGFDDEIVATDEAIATHRTHPSVQKIRENHGELAESFSFHCINPETVLVKLKCINSKKATGFDNIPGKLIRLAHRELASPLSKLINGCILSNSFPGIMKCAELSPVYKKQDKLQKGNYRPVSILTCISKIYESVLNDQLLEYFNVIFNDFISAFRKGHSCQSLLLKFIDDIKSALDNKHTVGAVFMDLSKAFDCLPHGLMVAKLHAYGLTRPACHLIADYLSDRKQRVKIANTRSSWVHLKKGVPQGSILGPLLFNIFINDMFMFIEKCSLYNYADDNALQNASKVKSEVIYNLEHDCRIAINWYDINGMQAHPTKFQFMIASPHPTECLKLKINDDTTIVSEPYIKCLGVYIDNKLSFSKHISEICVKAARQLNALARIAKFLDTKSRKIIYNSFVLSNLNYCPLVWHFCGKLNNDKLEKIQERSLRIVYDDYNSPYTDLIERAGSSTILLSRLRTMALEVFKSLKSISPPCLNELFHIKPHPYSMRHPIKLTQGKINTITHGLRSFSYTGAKLWNELPIDFTDFNDIDVPSFKEFLKNWAWPQNCDDILCHYF